MEQHSRSRSAYNPSLVLWELQRPTRTKDTADSRPNWQIHLLLHDRDQFLDGLVEFEHDRVLGESSYGNARR